MYRILLSNGELIVSSHIRAIQMMTGNPMKIYKTQPDYADSILIYMDEENTGDVICVKGISNVKPLFRDALKEGFMDLSIYDFAKVAKKFIESKLTNKA